MLNVVIPAHNEAALIGRCLAALVASQTPATARVAVVANGCVDDTADQARTHAARFAARGWTLEVIEQDRGHKPTALNAGDAACGAGPRVYLDADVVVSPGLIDQLCAVLDRPDPAYASGTLTIPRPWSAASRAYAGIYAQMPFMTQGVPGAGCFAVNAAGRARWGAFPDIIADDAFARLQFAPHERHRVPAPYDWPVVEGWAALVRVRRRQEAGMAQLRRLYPGLMRNDGPGPARGAALLRAALSDPTGGAIYATVGLWARLTRGAARGWSRGR